MNLGLWIMQGLLGLFIVAGIMKILQPVDKLSVSMAWVKRYSVGMVRFIGITELLGGIGVIVPWATGIMPILTPIAAAGLGIIQAAAAFDHLKNNESKLIPINIVFLLLAVAVAYGRWV